MKNSKIKNNEDAIIAAIKTATRSNFSLSFRVPVRKAGHVLDAAFLYDMGSFDTVRTRPFASVLIEPATGTLLEYCNAYIRDFADSGKYPMTLKIDYSVPFAKTAAQQGALVAKIDELYGSIRELAWKEELTEEGKRAVREYRDCFEKAVPKDLVVFYEALAPEFMGWMKQVESE